MVFWPLILIFSSLICIVALEYLRRYRDASLLWPKTEGRVVHVIDSYPDEGPCSPPTITYEFEVEGKKYQSTRFYYSWRSLTAYSYDEYLEDCRRYKRGSTVSVSYDPSDPNRCCLIPGPVHQSEFARDYAAVSLMGLTGVIAQVIYMFN